MCLWFPNARLGSIPDRSVAESAQHLSPTHMSTPSGSTAPNLLYVHSDAHLLEPVSSPIASRTRNHQAANQVLNGSDVIIANNTSELAYDHAHSSQTLRALQRYHEKHHKDFVCCEDFSTVTANAAKEAMKLQWSDLIFPGQNVKVKVKKELASAEFEKCV